MRQWMRRWRNYRVRRKPAESKARSLARSRSAQGRPEPRAFDGGSDGSSTGRNALTSLLISHHRNQSVRIGQPRPRSRFGGDRIRNSNADPRLNHGGRIGCGTAAICSHETKRTGGAATTLDRIAGDGAGRVHFSEQTAATAIRKRRACARFIRFAAEVIAGSMSILDPAGRADPFHVSIHPGGWAGPTECDGHGIGTERSGIH